MKRLLMAIGAAAVLALSPAASSGAAACGYTLGFKALADQVPDVVGDCRVDEHHNPANGDGLQETSRGLLVWRKADNFTAFTDGYRTWVNGPLGLQTRLNSESFDWERAAVVAQAAPQPGTMPTVGHSTAGTVTIRKDGGQTVCGPGMIVRNNNCYEH